MALHSLHLTLARCGCVPRVYDCELRAWLHRAMLRGWAHQHRDSTRTRIKQHLRDRGK